MPRSDAAPIMIVAGEASGDLHGATLCRALRSLAPGRRLVGMGGERMAAAGGERAAAVTAAALYGGPRGPGSSGPALPRVAPTDGRPARPEPPRRRRRDRLPRVQSAAGPRG